MEKEDSETGSEQKVYMRLRLWEFPDQCVIEPSNGSSASSLSVSRKDGSMKLIDSHQVYYFKEHILYTMLSGSYLMVITHCENAGSYLGNPVFKITSLKTFPCNHSIENTPAEHMKTEIEFCGLLNVAERTSGLFFSYATNLTLSIQRLQDLGAQSKSVPLWRQAEPRFIWNNYMLEVLIDNKLDPYILLVVQGSFHHFQSAIWRDIVDITLIATKCSRRNGTRMWRRGADSDGYVANFVETEQIMQINGYTASFVQVRAEESPRVMERHFIDLRKKYGAVLVVDLINKHGGEGLLNEKFADTVQSVIGDDARYLHFDFHRVCGHIHFDRLAILYDQISDFLETNG
ncbi:hypothetical protein K1719_019403 [Acacia pycnantha]|nr:hypothetical protein K1719_019403 [Acacia pycnantha]